MKKKIYMEILKWRMTSIKEIYKDYRFLLVLIVAMAMLIRTIPLFIYAAWGNDVGIYYYLTKKFIETKQFYFYPYKGWGSSYNFFPLLYVFASAIHLTIGISEFNALLAVGPILGGLCILLIYFIAREIGFEKKTALLSAVVLAVIPVHAYQTSHSAPLTVGHFFLLLSLLFYLKSHKSRKWIGPLYASTFLLILSHHLTTYMYLISIMFILFWRNLHSNKWTKHIWEDIFYVIFFVALTFSYWILVATPVYYNFMKGEIPLSSIQIVLLCYLLFLLAFLIVHIRRKYFPNLMVKPLIEPTTKKITIIFFLAFIITVLSAGLGQFFTLHWFSMEFVLWTIPFALMAGFGAVGWLYLRENCVRGWFLAIILSMFIAIIFGFSLLYPERHIEYISEPLSLLVGYGMAKIAGLVKKHQRIPLGTFAVAVIVANAASMIPMGEYSEGLCEGLPPSTLNLIKWMEEHISKDAVIASDQRISNWLFAYGFNTTYDKRGKTWYPYKLWNESNWLDCIDELKGKVGNDSYGRIDYIVIDGIMKNKGVGIKLYNVIPLTNESYEKFWKEPFILIYRNCTYEKNYMPKKINETIDYMNYSNATMMENVLDWAELYKIDWGYIEQYERDN
ncbi:hypothetical protein B6U81_00225 [Thermoplasmatales archaeon ex4484_30]|nr:MAG: hypothetical protein B6U81_00225 [Thermoplasmatales archaeon ex4484_30]